MVACTVIVHDRRFVVVDVVFVVIRRNECLPPCVDLLWVALLNREHSRMCQISGFSACALVSSSLAVVTTGFVVRDETTRSLSPRRWKP